MIIIKEPVMLVQQHQEQSKQINFAKVFLLLDEAQQCANRLTEIRKQ